MVKGSLIGRVGYMMSTVYLHLGQCGNQLGQAFWEEASTSKWSGAYNTHADSKRPGKQAPPMMASAGGKVPSSGSVMAVYTLPPGARKRASSSSSVAVAPGLPSSIGGKVPSATVAPGTKGKVPSSNSSKVQTSGSRGKVSTSAPAYVPFTLTDGSVPCVMVDTEPKVIRRCLDTKKNSTLLAHRVPRESCVWGGAGRGNNWAYGYHGTSGCGAGVLERAQEAVRKVVERCDRFSGFVMLHSIAGGTGSGLGSALLECLRADYPLPYIITATVTPFGSGETPLQHLNSLLCLSWLQSFTDAVLLFGNDTVLEQTHKHLSRVEGGVGGRGDKEGVCVEDMNRYVSSVLCNTLMPIWKIKQKSPNLSFQEGWEMIRSLCPDPATKLLTSNHVHTIRPSHTWHQTTSLLLQHGSRREAGAHAGKAKTTSLACIIRGSPSALEQFVPELHPLEAKLKKAYNTVNWNPFPVDYWASYEPNMGHTKLATVLANSSVVLDYVETVYDRASAMFHEGAYLHWYERFGCERDTFKQAFEHVQGVMDTYRDI